jgi:uncharacterized protein involved in response to NO
MSPDPIQPSGLPSGSIGGRRRSAGAAAWQARQLLAAPHRLAFSAGALMMCLALLWWGTTYLARTTGVALPWAVAAPSAHGLLLCFGVMPCFIAGLAFSVAPRWLGGRDVSARALLLPLAGVLAGWALATVGFHVSAALAAAGLALAAGGFALVAGRFAVQLIESRTAERDHARLLLLGMGLAVLAQWAAAVGVALGQDGLARAAVQAALWGGFGLTLVVFAHRKLPQFTSAQLLSQVVWRTRSLLGFLAVLMLVQAVFAATDALAGAEPAAIVMLARAAIELGSGLLLFWLSFGWGLRHSLGASAPAVDDAGVPVTVRRGALRLLAMLHLAFGWLAVACTLAGVSHGMMLASGGQVSLGQVPMHAFTMGFLGTCLLALATQMALAHSGRPLAADGWTWALCWVVQAGVLFRVLAVLFPVAATPLTLLALQFWAVAAVTWAVRSGRWFGMPRVDGGAG